MAEFSYDTYFNSLLTTGNYRFAPKDCNKDEYRKGLVDTSKGIISVFDVDGKKNGKLNKAEYLLKEKKDYELSGGNAEYDEQKALDIFETLDINNDGELFFITHKDNNKNDEDKEDNKNNIRIKEKEANDGLI